MNIAALVITTFVMVFLVLLILGILLGDEYYFWAIVEIITKITFVSVCLIILGFLCYTNLVRIING
jgi:amino acid transporter